MLQRMDPGTNEVSHDVNDHESVSEDGDDDSNTMHQTLNMSVTMHVA